MDSNPPSSTAEEQGSPSATEERPTLHLPFDDAQVAEIRAGQWVQLKGTIYLIGRRATQRLLQDLEAGHEVPVELEGQIVLHAHTTPPPFGKVIGSVSPEYAAPYDLATHALLDHGVRGVIGRGQRDDTISAKLTQARGLYLVTTGGALLARCVVQSEVVAYDDLGPSAIRRLKVSNLPALVAIDGFGRNVFQLPHSGADEYYSSAELPAATS